MKSQISKRNFFLSLIVLVLVFSCRTEDDLSIDPDTSTALKVNSTLANLMMRVATNDGSDDNIIDNSSCLSVQLPVTVTVNGIIIEVLDTEDYGDIKDIIDLSTSDVDSIVISYPITVILTNHTKVVVNSKSELDALAINCLGENEADEDIECIDFKYPLTMSYFNEKTESLNAILLKNDNEMYHFIENLHKFSAVTINFPVTVIFADGLTQKTSNVQELEDTILLADNTCDEDDNNDFDDDCTSCSSNELKEILLTCEKWKVEKLKKNNNYHIKTKDGYAFKFYDNGTLKVVHKTNTYNGTWTTSGTGTNIILMLNVIGLPEFNLNWELRKIDKKKSHIDLRSGTSQLHFKSGCSKDGDNDDDD